MSVQNQEYTEHLYGHTTEPNVDCEWCEVPKKTFISKSFFDFMFMPIGEHLEELNKRAKSVEAVHKKASR